MRRKDPNCWSPTVPPHWDEIKKGLSIQQVMEIPSSWPRFLFRGHYLLVLYFSNISGVSGPGTNTMKLLMKTLSNATLKTEFHDFCLYIDFSPYFENGCFVYISWYSMVSGSGTYSMQLSMKNPVQNNPQISIPWICFYTKNKEMQTVPLGPNFRPGQLLAGQVLGNHGIKKDMGASDEFVYLVLLRKSRSTEAEQGI